MIGLALWSLAASFGLVYVAASRDFEIRDGPNEGPKVEIGDAGVKVTFTGLRYNTTMYGNDNGVPNDGSMVEAFLGIPYAESPQGLQRFREVALRNVSTLPVDFDASFWRPGCMQEPGMFTNETSDFSENCLYLNIWRRKGSLAGDSKPVVLIIHGGGYSAGDGHELDWRGPQMAYFGDLIVVNINYRLGIFGFLDLNLPNAGGHQGHLDQVRAFEWVSSYISHFGGDPSRVTLFGVSAGSFSISWHLMTGLAQGLFHAAVMDAGVLTHTHAETPSDHIERAAQLAEASGCRFRKRSQIGRQKLSAHAKDILACLKALLPTQLVKLQQRFAPSQTYTFRPTYNNQHFLPVPPECIINGHRFRVQVPIIIGDTTNEGQFLLTRRTHDPKPCLSSFAQLMAWNLRILGGHHADHALTRGADDGIAKSVYDHAAEDESCASFQHAASQMIGDGLFVCPVMNFAEKYSRVQPDTYLFRWDRIRDSETYPGERRDGAYHGLMFYTGAGGQYLYLKGAMTDRDKLFISNTIKMIAGFSADPQQTPRFGTAELVRYGRHFVNNFAEDGLSVLVGHPSARNCQTAWPIFSRFEC